MTTPEAAPQEHGDPRHARDQASNAPRRRGLVIGIVVAVVMLLLACALPGVAFYMLIDKANTAERNREATARRTCQTQNYPGQRPGTDICADVRGAVRHGDLTLTATQLRRDSLRNICAVVAYALDPDADQEVWYDARSWNLQTPTGAIPESTGATAATLGRGRLVPGGEVSGTVCFPPGPAGLYVLVYEPDPDDIDDEWRGIWVKEFPG